VIKMGKFQYGFTLVEIIITIVLVGLVLVPLGIMSIEYVRGTFYSRDLGIAEGLAKSELAKVNSLDFNDPTLADGYDNTASNYEGYPFDLRRTVNIVNNNNALKQVQVRVYPAGDLSRQLVSVTTFIVNATFGAGSGGELVDIVHSCFLAGTPILMADGSLKPIEQVKVGDQLVAFDEKTAVFKNDKVKEVSQHAADRYLIVNGNLKVTSNHLVYSNGRWEKIGSLKVGDKLFDSNGKEETINDIKEIAQKVTVYNLEVNPYHTYVAGGFLVHNKTIPYPVTPYEMDPVP